MTTAVLSAPKAQTKTNQKMSLQKIVSRNMRMAIAYYDVDQQTVANAIGISSSGVSLKMRGKVDWSLRDIEKASDFFNVKPEALVAGSGFEPETSGL